MYEILRESAKNKEYQRKGRNENKIRVSKFKGSIYSPELTYVDGFCKNNFIKLLQKRSKLLQRRDQEQSRPVLETLSCHTLPIIWANYLTLLKLFLPMYCILETNNNWGLKEIRLSMELYVVAREQ